MWREYLRGHGWQTFVLKHNRDNRRAFFLCTGCVKITKQTRRHFDRREKSSLQRAKSDFEISRCARNDKNDMKMVLFTQPVWVGGYRGKAAKPSPRCPIDKELSVISCHFKQIFLFICLKFLKNKNKHRNESLLPCSPDDYL